MTAAPGYHVLYDRIRPDTDLDPVSMLPVSVHKVTYVIDTGPHMGVQRVVAVPDERFTEDGVRAALEADLDNFTRIALLKR